jgi:hypothetical protein
VCFSHDRFDLGCLKNHFLKEKREKKKALAGARAMAAAKFFGYK